MTLIRKLFNFYSKKFDSKKLQTDADTDIETVTIGSQIVTKSNLKIAHYRNGDFIPEVKDSKTWESLTSGAWCYYNNDPTNEAIYGKLYNWYAVNDPRGLAPAGWHVPSEEEWTALRNYLGDSDLSSNKTSRYFINIEKTSGNKMKATFGWSGSNIGVTNSSGFSGLPGGGRNIEGSFALIKENGCWWSSSPHDNISSAAYNFSIFNDNFGGCSASMGADDMGSGFSVRCMKD